MVKSLEEAIQKAGSPVDLLWHSKTQPAIVPRVVPEFTNWRDEQLAWRRNAVLFDQSHHMAELTVKGPDALKLISHLSTNSFKNFTVDKAKQMAPVNYNGQVVGDGILFYLPDNQLCSVGRNPTANWIQYNAQAGKYDVKVEYDDRSPSRPMGKPVVRKWYRYQIQGPNAHEVIKKLNGGPMPDIKVELVAGWWQGNNRHSKFKISNIGTGTGKVVHVWYQSVSQNVPEDETDNPSSKFDILDMAPNASQEFTVVCDPRDE